MTVPVAFAPDRSDGASNSIVRPPNPRDVEPGPEQSFERKIALALSFVDEVLVPRLSAGERLTPRLTIDLLDRFLETRERMLPDVSLDPDFVETVLIFHVMTLQDLETADEARRTLSADYLQVLQLCFEDDETAIVL